jgi:hypothetical protein
MRGILSDASAQSIRDRVAAMMQTHDTREGVARAVRLAAGEPQELFINVWLSCKGDAPYSQVAESWAECKEQIRDGIPEYSYYRTIEMSPQSRARSTVVAQDMEDEARKA